MKTLKKRGTLKSVKTVVSKSKVVDLNTLTGDELFLYSLKTMGHPSLVRDMVKSLKKTKRVSLTKKQILTRFYASASRLNALGIVKRMPVNGSMYIYSLINWKFNKTQKERKLRLVA